MKGKFYVGERYVKLSQVLKIVEDVCPYYMSDSLLTFLQEEIEKCDSRIFWKENKTEKKN